MSRIQLPVLKFKWSCFFQKCHQILIVSMSARIVSQEKGCLMVHTRNEKTQAARKELLFPAYAALSTTIVVS